MHLINIQRQFSMLLVIIWYWIDVKKTHSIKYILHKKLIICHHSFILLIFSQNFQFDTWGMLIIMVNQVWILHIIINFKSCIKSVGSSNSIVGMTFIIYTRLFFVVISISHSILVHSFAMQYVLFLDRFIAKSVAKLCTSKAIILTFYANLQFKHIINVTHLDVSICFLSQLHFLGIIYGI